MKKQLSPREKEVLTLVSNGDTSSVIASKLFISARTVDSHIKTLKKKLGAKNIQHAVRLGIENRDVVLSDNAVNAMYKKMKIINNVNEAIDEYMEQNNAHVSFLIGGVISSDSHVKEGRTNKDEAVIQPRTISGRQIGDDEIIVSNPAIYGGMPFAIQKYMKPNGQIPNLNNSDSNVCPAQKEMWNEAFEKEAENLSSKHTGDSKIESILKIHKAPTMPMRKIKHP